MSNRIKVSTFAAILTFAPAIHAMRFDGAPKRFDVRRCGAKGIPESSPVRAALLPLQPSGFPADVYAVDKEIELFSNLPSYRRPNDTRNLVPQ